MSYVFVHVCRKESVTLPDRNESDLEEIERSVNFSNNVTGIGEFQRTTFIAMVSLLNLWLVCLLCYG